MDLSPPPREEEARLPPLAREVLRLREAAIRRLARDPGEVGALVRTARPDLAPPPPEGEVESPG